MAKAASDGRYGTLDPIGGEVWVRGWWGRKSSSLRTPMMGGSDIDDKGLVADGMLDNPRDSEIDWGAQVPRTGGLFQTRRLQRPVSVSTWGPVIDELP